ncbi:MAG: hypothetical protein AAF696_18820 [Bacteroidota bacterium]
MKERRDHTEGWQEEFGLEKLDEKQPFKLPENYFEGVEKRLFEKITKEVEESHSDFLRSLPKKEVFQTPAAYFEGVWGRFQEKKDAEENKGKVLTFRWSYVLAVAAAVVLLLLIFFPQNQEFVGGNGEVELALEEVSFESLIAEVEAEALSEDLLLSSFPEEGFGEWLEEEDLEEKEEVLIELPETPIIDDFIDEMDVYMLEEELEDLNFEGMD